jgi:hypothetical protein
MSAAASEALSPKTDEIGAAFVTEIGDAAAVKNAPLESDTMTETVYGDPLVEVGVHASDGVLAETHPTGSSVQK